MTFAILFQALVSGLSQSAVYAVVAIGLTLTLGVMRVVNFAHGEFLMLAMYAAFFAWQFLGIDPIIVVVLLVPISVGMGYLFYKLIVQRLLDISATNQMAATLGTSLFLQSLAILAFSSDNRLVSLDRSLIGVPIGPAYIQIPQLTLAIASVLLVAVLYFLIRKTEFGLRLRAVSETPSGAMLCGINAVVAHLAATCIAMITLGAAGPLLVSSLYVNPYIGVLFTLKAFIIVIVGGLGSFEGALLAAVLLGVTESIAGIWLPASTAAAIPFLFLILTLLIKPDGLFGSRETR